MYVVLADPHSRNRLIPGNTQLPIRRFDVDSTAAGVATVSATSRIMRLSRFSLKMTFLPSQVPNDGVGSTRGVSVTQLVPLDVLGYVLLVDKVHS